ncbi:HD domain-containing protein [Marinifilum sp.]|uniref:HD domain-containing protein n=1 Tax=Marinifilum sp. TaxID=2033137 RepID=UPI003BAA123F
MLFFNSNHVNQEIYENIECWFINYTKHFYSKKEEIQLNLDLQKNHSFNTVEIISDLSTLFEFNETDTLTAKAIALLHDIGRFIQLSKFGTFAESDQLNHCDLGISILEKENVLSDLNEDTIAIILECIRFHDIEELPKSINKNAMDYLKILRDADRIDVLNIVSNYYSECKIGTNKRLELELSNKPEISQKVYKSILAEKVVNKKDINSINELKIHQMSWVFDLNYQMSFQIVSQKNYLKKIYESLPKKDEVIDMYRQMKIYLENNL